MLGDPRLPRTVIAAAAMTVAVALAVLASPFWLFLLTSALITGLLARSIGIVFGTAGMVSLCQVSFAGLAGWIVGWLNVNTTLPFELQLLAAVAVVTPVGALVGLPALRLRGINLAVVTLGFALAASVLVFNGAFPGINQGVAVQRPILSADTDAGLFLFVVVMVLAVEWVLAYLHDRPLGASWRSVRHSERTTAALGRSVARTKLSAFAVSAALAAVAGGLMATQIGTLSGRSFTGTTSLVLFALAVFAGAQVPVGAVLAGAVFVGFPELLRIVGLPVDFAMMAFAVGAIQALTQGTEGVAGGWQAAWHRRRTAANTKSEARPSPGSQDRAPGDPASAPTRPAGSAAASPVGEDALRVSGLTVDYGAVRAVADVDLEVRAGTVHGLIGPNGAGKSSFIDAVTGFTPCDGAVVLAGERLDALDVAARARRGLRRTFQKERTIPELTIRQMVGLATRTVEDQSVERLLARFGLPGPDTRISGLDMGQRRRLEVVVVLAANPRVALLDEPAAGLTDEETRQLGCALREHVGHTGVGVLLVEHDMDLVRSICDGGTVLDRGQVIADGSPDSILSDPAVQTAYLGLVPVAGDPA